jgi:hypothetical protein
MNIDPLVLFSTQFTFVLVTYVLLARWYVWPRMSQLPPVVALVPLIGVHVFRIAGGSILAPGSVGPGVPAEFREMVGYGDMATAVLALVTLIALRAWGGRAVWFVWLFVSLALIDTANAVIQSMRFHVFDEPLGVNWLIVTMYVPALLVSSYLIVFELLRRGRTPRTR